VPHLVSSSTSERLDVELMFPGDRFPVIVGPVLRAAKWRGGLWVMYVASTEGDFSVEVSDGTMTCGFLLFQSENYALAPPYGDGAGSNANWISGQPATGAGGQNVVTLVNGGTRCFFKMFETVALAGGTRSGGAITYSLNDALKVSENGLLCNDSDAQFALVGIANPIQVGIVSAAPSVSNGNRLGADIKY
jgi:hypothetical protein